MLTRLIAAPSLAAILLTTSTLATAAAAAQTSEPAAHTASAPTNRATARTAAKPTIAKPTIARPTIVLVHGALANATSWSRVISTLQRAGYYVTAVENPLSSFDADVATTKRVIDAQQGDVIVVGHSYGGAVLSSAAAGNPRVKGLVYIAALAPDSGEAVAANLDKYPAPLATAFVPDAAGFLYVDRAKMRDVFAADLPTAETDVLAATQKPINSAIFQTVVTRAAWRSIPSWYLVAAQDRAVNPALERMLAKRMNATTVEITSSHLPMLSHPAAVAQLIERAARSALTAATPSNNSTQSTTSR